MDARSVLASAVMTVVLPTSGHIGSGVSGLHISGRWTQSFQVRWEPGNGTSGYAIEVHNSAGALVRDFLTRHDYANVGGLRPGKTYVLTIRQNTPGSAAVSLRVQTATPESLGQEIARYARTFVGRARYVYGGTGPETFDCSGLTQYVYRHFGRSIPRTAEEQYQYFHPESSDRARPGDLVFFGSPVYHVGIFEGGDMMVAAATESEGIRYQQIYSDAAMFGAFSSRTRDAD